MHTVTESVLTSIINRPNSPVTHGNLTCGEQCYDIHKNENITGVN